MKKKMQSILYWIKKNRIFICQIASCLILLILGFIIADGVKEILSLYTQEMDEETKTILNIASTVIIPQAIFLLAVGTLLELTGILSILMTVISFLSYKKNKSLREAVTGLDGIIKIIISVAAFLMLRWNFIQIPVAAAVVLSVMQVIFCKKNNKIKKKKERSLKEKAMV